MATEPVDPGQPGSTPAAALPDAGAAVPAQGGADDLSRFLIRSPAQIGQILRAIADHGELVTAYFNRGREFLLTAIVDVDIPGKTVLIDRATEPALNEKLLASDRIVLVSAHEKVKVQFSARQVREAQSGGRPAFAFALPVDLLKLQRREFFRVRAAAGEPVRCRLPLTDRDLLDLPVLDISIGGIAAHAPLPAALAQVGRQFPRASLQIGDGGAFIVDLELRNVNAVRLPNGIDALRCGFRFVGLPEVAQQQIQRYILRVERDRKSREAELRA